MIGNSQRSEEDLCYLSKYLILDIIWGELSGGVTLTDLHYEIRDCLTCEKSKEQWTMTGQMNNQSPQRKSIAWLTVFHL